MYYQNITSLLTDCRLQNLSIAAGYNMELKKSYSEKTKKNKMKILKSYLKETYNTYHLILRLSLCEISMSLEKYWTSRALSSDL